MIKFSIITPTLNQGSFIEQTIKSVLSQDYKDKELIVVDGGSTDATLDILRKYKEVKWISEPDTGAANAINKGLKMAGGDVVAWLNSDDFYDKDTLSIVADEFEKHPDAGIVYGNLTFVNEHGEILWNDHTAEYSRDVLLRRNADMVRQPCTFFRKKLFDEMGDLDESLKCVFDYDLIVRFLGSAYPKYVNTNLAFYRDYADTLTRKYIRKQGKEIIKVAVRNGARFYDRIVLSSLIKKILLPWIFFNK